MMGGVGFSPVNGIFQLAQPNQRRYRVGKVPGHAARRKLDRDRKSAMFRLFLQWFLTAVALLIVSMFVPGFKVAGLWPALIAALVIGLLNATLGFFLKVVTFPLTILTLGIFLLVINALMIWLASTIVKGFHVSGFLPAFWGGIVLALLGMLIRATTSER